eukprot:gene9314-biopygen350
MGVIQHCPGHAWHGCGTLYARVCQYELPLLTSASPHLSFSSPQLLLTSASPRLSFPSPQLLLTSASPYLSFSSPQLLLA